MARRRAGGGIGAAPSRAAAAAATLRHGNLDLDEDCLLLLDEDMQDQGRADDVVDRRREFGAFLHTFMDHDAVGAILAIVDNALLPPKGFGYLDLAAFATQPEDFWEGTLKLMPYVANSIKALLKQRSSMAAPSALAPLIQHTSAPGMLLPPAVALQHHAATAPPAAVQQLLDKIQSKSQATMAHINPVAAMLKVRLGALCTDTDITKLHGSKYMAMCYDQVLGGFDVEDAESTDAIERSFGKRCKAEVCDAINKKIATKVHNNKITKSDLDLARQRIKGDKDDDEAVVEARELEAKLLPGLLKLFKKAVVHPLEAEDEAGGAGKDQDKAGQAADVPKQAKDQAAKERREVKHGGRKAPPKAAAPDTNQVKKAKKPRKGDDDDAVDGL